MNLTLYNSCLELSLPKLTGEMGISSRVTAPVAPAIGREWLDRL